MNKQHLVEQLDRTTGRLRDLTDDAVLIPDGFGDMTDQVVDLVKQVLAGCDPSRSVVRAGHAVGVVVIPLSNPNYHDYEIGQPCVIHHLGIDGDATALKMDGTIGEQYFPREPGSYRLATRTEIETFVDGLVGELVVVPYTKRRPIIIYVRE